MVPPLPRLTGWQGCHGGSDQALDAQGAEGAAQEAAGEGQELGTGEGHKSLWGKGRPTPRTRAVMGFRLHRGVNPSAWGEAYRTVGMGK